ncbi:MAG TPA: LLM class flavin-dependent oxidoreductase [Candidatus Binataceae bacterium]|nr:LLM class flavin-dependent oxidoreductase [Candidatus Binataceae bacterium]
MKHGFGVFDHLERRGASVEGLYAGRLKLLEQYDAAGFYSYHVAEHHATPLGMAPSPGLFLAAAAQRTRRIRLGPLVYLLPLYNPFRLAVEVCMLDHLSGGRVDLGVGRGVSPFELAYLGVSFMDSRQIFEEALTALVTGLREDRLNHHGKHYRFDNVPMELRPIQRPNPPFWYGVTSPESVSFAARHGMHMVGLGPIPMVKGMTEQYREELGRHRGGPDDLNPSAQAPIMGALRHAYVAGDEREIESIAAPAYRTYYNNITKLWRDFRTLPAYGFTPEIGVAAKADSAIVGTASQVRDQIGRFFSESGCNYLVLSFAFGSLSDDDASRSVERFVSHVMPSFAENSSTAARGAG